MGQHVAILKKRYLERVLTGEKTVECRLTRTALAPYRAVTQGDTLYFKCSAGPYMARATAGRVEFHEGLTAAKIAQLSRRFNKSVRGEREFWHERRGCRYATFIELRDVRPITRGPVLAPSRGLAWFVLGEGSSGSQRAHRLAAKKPSGSGSFAGGLGESRAVVQAGSTRGRTSGARYFFVELTAGAIRNSYVRLPRSIACQVPASVELVLPNDVRVVTEVLGSGMVRWRGWKRFFEARGLGPGDQVRFATAESGRYRIQFIRNPRNPRKPRPRNSRPG